MWPREVVYPPDLGGALASYRAQGRATTIGEWRLKEWASCAAICDLSRNICREGSGCCGRIKGGPKICAGLGGSFVTGEAEVCTVSDDMNYCGNKVAVGVIAEII